jgi:hypothetical protein
MPGAEGGELMRQQLPEALFDLENVLRSNLPDDIYSDSRLWEKFQALRALVDELVARGVFFGQIGVPETFERTVGLLHYVARRLNEAYNLNPTDYEIQRRVKTGHRLLRQVAECISRALPNEPQHATNQPGASPTQEQGEIHA